MTYQECIDFLYEQLPMYQRDGESAYKKDLTNTLALCSSLDNPHLEYPIIHVAGTNGKGSVCHMLSAILQSEGFNVGLYTSPHYFDFRERMKINGKLISKEEVIDLVDSLLPMIEDVRPSFFELTVAMAFRFFADRKVDFAIIETGLGGRLDSTNVVLPILSVITNISFDHQSILGNTLPLIAAEKAGIIKHQVPVIVGERSDATDNVFIDKALAMEAPLVFAEETIQFLTHEFFQGHFIVTAQVPLFKEAIRLQVGLTAHYQLINLRTVLAAITELCRQKQVCVSLESLKEGLASVVELAGLQGRWQIVRKKPLVIADSGHNPGGLGVALGQLYTLGNRNLRIVFGVAKDKSFLDMLTMLPKNATYYWCAAGLSRALSSTDLKKQGEELGLEGQAYPSVQEALNSALAEATEADIIFIGGSTFVVGEVLGTLAASITLDE